MNLEAIIGLEIHVELKTQSKMFCACENVSFKDADVNSSVCPLCMGYPGTLPVPNKKAIELTHIVGAALGCELAEKSKFDRKHYFYPDLPKGYQISQFDKPFCGKGQLRIVVEGEERTIGITRIHLEEDAAKNLHPSTGSGQVPYTLVDYNRAGTPLIEIVTEPDIRSPQEAKVFLQELQRIVRMLGVSDADMEKGQMRCDANISLRKAGESVLNPKTEVKNVNSFRFVERALQYEIARQTRLWESGEVPSHTTRGYDSVADKTVEQRTKEAAADYRYFPEPDIPPFTFEMEYFDGVRRNIPELPAEKRDRFEREFGLPSQLAMLFTQNTILADFFENVASELAGMEQQKLTPVSGKMILRELRSGDLGKITAENFAEVVVLLDQGKMNSSAVQQVLSEMKRTGGDPDAILQNLGLEQLSGESDLAEYVDEVVASHSDVVQKIKQGKESALQFLMGQVMAKSGGKANPAVVIAMLRKKMGI